MERRDFLKAAFGFGLGAVAVASAAKAAPLAVQPLTDGPAPQPEVKAQPAVADEKDVAQLKAEQVHWRRRHWHPHWGWRHRRRHWRRWHRRHWRRRWRRHHRYYW
ncbi:twin-arginine translocation signal domain-containing protein [Afipia sp. TerB]